MEFYSLNVFKPVYLVESCSQNVSVSVFVVESYSQNVSYVYLQGGILFLDCVYVCLQGGILTSYIHGADAPQVSKVVAEQLASEHKILEGTGERREVSVLICLNMLHIYLKYFVLYYTLFYLLCFTLFYLFCFIHQSILLIFICFIFCVLLKPRNNSLLQDI